MFRNVIVGVDGRPAGRDAIALARRLSAPDAAITLLFARTDYAGEESSQAQELLEREREQAGVEAELVSVLSFTPGGALHRQAELAEADLIVVGSCAHGILGRAMLGDDTRAALNGAPCAVAIAAHGFAERPSVGKVGIAYDGSPESVAALAAARKLARLTGASLHALEVVSLPPASYGPFMTPVGDAIEAMVDEASLRVADLAGVDGRAVYGIPGEELARFGDELDIMLLGSRGYGPLHRMISGSTANYLERHARCSLLVLPRVPSPIESEEASDNSRSIASPPSSDAATASPGLV